MGYAVLKDLRMLVWLTQLGMSTAIPMAGFILLALWLKQRFGLGGWVIIAGCVVGLVCAIDGFMNSMKAMEAIDAAIHDKRNVKKPAPANKNNNGK